ncbi:MGT family glycosyltransferase [Pseudonocardia sediminis]|uniref:MGT family glycosyltransferase n=1 Tax=Pseudonocardia sediminis TaxID=1397368 RepID=A0A4Q7UPM9_PSEST|nr:macrolide family glycosyltransferase [Pseudonocardia sediminis]RZT83476.1 MGT family glycosyltransferase [Pseudonocardia sediminis]
MSRHFAFVSMPAHGHINPTLPLVTELVRRGHRVTYATGAEMAGTVRAAGAEPVEVPFSMPDGPPPMTGGTPPDPDDMARRMQAFATSVEDTFPVLVEHFGRDRPDALCGDAMSPVSSLVAQELDLPFVSLNPSFAGNEHFDLRRDVLNRSPVAAAMAPVFAGLAERVAKFARSRGLRHDAAVFGTPGELNLVFVPRSFQPAGDTFDDTFVFLGPSVAGRSGDVGWEPRDPDAPLLLISLGTVFNDRPDFFRLCAEAFGGSRWQVLMAVGERVDLDAIGELPGNIEVRVHVPQVQVLERADAFLTHNGMNSTMEALWFGVPQVGVPQMPEQDMNARRVQELGCGRRLDPDALDARTLLGTVDAVADDAEVRASCERLSAELRSTDGPSTGADALERLVSSRARGEGEPLSRR